MGTLERVDPRRTAARDLRGAGRIQAQHLALPPDRLAGHGAHADQRRQAIWKKTCTSYPFGDGLSCTGTDATEHHFTTKERDAESGLDYFYARYYSSILARFMTPDWAAAPTAVPYATFGDPQTLNLYAYVNNNPNTGIDMDGHVNGFGNDLPTSSFEYIDNGKPDQGGGNNGNNGSGSNSTSPSGQTSDENGNDGKTGGDDKSKNVTPAPKPQNPSPKNPPDNQKQPGQNATSNNSNSNNSSQQPAAKSPAPNYAKMDTFSNLYHAIMDKWTADTNTCKQLNVYAADLHLVSDFGVPAGSSLALQKMKGAGWAGLWGGLEGAIPAISGDWISRWTASHCQ